MAQLWDRSCLSDRGRETNLSLLSVQTELADACRFHKPDGAVYNPRGRSSLRRCTRIIKNRGLFFLFYSDGVFWSCSSESVLSRSYLSNTHHGELGLEQCFIKLWRWAAIEVWLYRQGWDHGVSVLIVYPPRVRGARMAPDCGCESRTLWRFAWKPISTRSFTKRRPVIFFCR